MKYFFLVFTFLFSVSLVAQNKSLPSVDIKNLDGKSINIQDFANDGKITVLSFWATWCIPCQNELDAIADLYPEWQEDYGVELVAITIDTRRQLAKVKPIITQKGWEYTFLSDEKQSLQQALNFQAITQTFVLDKNGEIVYSHSGYIEGDEEELGDFLKELAEN